MSLRQKAEADRLGAEVVRFARSMVGLSMSPTGLVVLCFAELGVSLADDLLALHRAGDQILGSDLLPADLIFRTGPHDVFHPGERRYGIGHVGIYTGDKTVIHASFWSGRVDETDIDEFFDAAYGHFRGTRRIIART